MELKNNLDFQILITAAHRYALQRRTYTAASVASWMCENRDKLIDQTVCVAMRDTIQAYKDGVIGSPFAWIAFLLDTEANLLPGTRMWLERHFKLNDRSLREYIEQLIKEAEHGPDSAVPSF